MDCLLKSPVSAHITTPESMVEFSWIFILGIVAPLQFRLKLDRCNGYFTWDLYSFSRASQCKHMPTNHLTRKRKQSIDSIQTSLKICFILEMLHSVKIWHRSFTLYCYYTRYKHSLCSSKQRYNRAWSEQICCKDAERTYGVCCVMYWLAALNAKNADILQA
jgi:hypothetical protein